MAVKSYAVKINGTAPLIQHATTGMNDDHPGVVELKTLAKKKGSNRTDEDKKRMRDLESILSVWERDGQVTVNPAALRACIEAAARTLKQGPQVRRGLRVDYNVDFKHDVPGKDFVEVAINAKWTTDVKVGQSRIMRTRAKFDDWSVVFKVNAEDSLVDQQQLETWLKIAGEQIGIGDWRPDKSGFYGTFDTEYVEPYVEPVEA